MTMHVTFPRSLAKLASSVDTFVAAILHNNPKTELDLLTILNPIMTNAQEFGGFSWGASKEVGTISLTTHESHPFEIITSTGIVGFTLFSDMGKTPDLGVVPMYVHADGGFSWFYESVTDLMEYELYRLLVQAAYTIAPTLPTETPT